MITIRKKKAYVAPLITIEHLDMEDNIAAGSVRYNPLSGEAYRNLSAENYMDDDTHEFIWDINNND